MIIIPSLEAIEVREWLAKGHTVSRCWKQQANTGSAAGVHVCIYYVITTTQENMEIRILRDVGSIDTIMSKASSRQSAQE